MQHTQHGLRRLDLLRVTVYELPRIGMRLAAHGHARREKPRLSTTGRPPEGVRTRTPRCDAAKRSMTLAGRAPLYGYAICQHARYSYARSNCLARRRSVCVSLPTEPGS